MSQMSTHRLHSNGRPPFFAEVPYYVWGQVNSTQRDPTAPAHAVIFLDK